MTLVKLSRMVTYHAGSGRRLASTLGPIAADTFAGLFRGYLPQRPPESYAPGADAGTLLRSWPIPAVGLRGRQQATSFDYVTTDSRGQGLVASGALFRSGRPGPLVGFAPSTQGVARHCNPSYSCSVGLRGFWPPDFIAAYEQPSINWFLDAGADVVLIDYPRDPVHNVQLYCDHLAGANALADAVTVARCLGAGGTLGLWGFSQGGGAVGAYLEHGAGEKPAAAVVGAPPARLDDVVDHVDGSLVSGVIAYTVAGLMVSDEDIHAEIAGQLTPRGLKQLDDNLATCSGGSLLTSGWHHTSTWTASGRPLGELIDELPATSAEIGRRRLGAHDPDVPVRLWGSIHDDVIPFPMIDKLHQAWPSAEWHARELRRIPGRTGLNHFAPYFQWLPDDSAWLLGHLR